MIWSHRRPDQTTPTAYVFCVLCAPSDFNAHGHASHETHGKIAIHAWFVLIRCMHMMAWVLRCLEANQLRLCQIDIFYIIFNPRIWMTKMPDDGIKWESKLAISIYVDLSPYACDACTCVHQLHNVQVKSGWLRCSKTPPRWLYTLTVYMTLQQQHQNTSLMIIDISFGNLFGQNPVILGKIHVSFGWLAELPPINNFWNKPTGIKKSWSVPNVYKTIHLW